MSVFNYELFYLNGHPMKFYLDGYTSAQTRDVADIVEAFGGRFSEPGENTIIFSYPGAPNEGNFDRFDSKFFFDSITTGQLQTLDNYRFSSTRITSSIERSRNELSINPGVSSRNPNSTNSEDDHQNFNSLNSFNKPSSSAAPETAITSSTFISTQKDNHSDDVISFRMDDTLKPTPPLTRTKSQTPKSTSNLDKFHVETGKGKTIARNILYSKEESEKVLKFLAKNKAACDSLGVSVWRRMEQAKIFVNPYRSHKSLYKHYSKKLRTTYESNLTDKRNLAKRHKTIADIHDK